ncbi:beta-1,4-N-acetylgalactosaminyltransferase bre-4-like [Aricia agestis]|uniref:beta-1,4-N-acetylgalactosaminyltransferase bre-4-like n=1 Tax=Aricia agestis TaxID=91739 RepID=UPI001C208268|nr:beta-1,4-N-acetylgalactosaminyltransferase bre-4-like [Aricia agestis]XP_041978113.1 beta-1,4-N-acetylgalactosaminyltransferase bre-4-like [Aricia agestis]
MSKWIPKVLRRRPTTVGCVVLGLIALVQLFAAHGYNYIPLEDVERALLFAVNPKIGKENKPPCVYGSVINKTKTVDSTDLPKKFNEFMPNGIVSGSYMPENCRPLISVALLVTYRNRQNQLDVFVPYMHNFLRKQNIHYKIYVIEQEDDKPWNKGKLYNIGAKYAIADKFPCLILHDVDLLPLDESNLYACLGQPRHMSASIDKFRFVLPYDTLVGGVLAISSDQYVQINGFSNRFNGWGGEDDDLAARILKHNLLIWRLPPHMSRYSMLPHKQEAINADRHKIMQENLESSARDGMDTVRYESVNVKDQRLYTLIGVKL